MHLKLAIYIDFIPENMKESHLFYAPDVANSHTIPEEEAAHAIRVLRIKEGDPLWLTDGRGLFFEATASPAGSSKHPECYVAISSERSWDCPWPTPIHIAVAPTKNMDRIEWLAEKATEIGLDGIHFIDCTFSERHVIKTERIEKIVISAMKQSHKAIKPKIGKMMRFRDFITQPFDGDKFIAHCYEQQDIDGSEKFFLFDVVKRDVPTLILIGPEGDFSIEEVRAAHAAGFQSITLGESRLRTETAALTAVVHTNLKKTH